MKGIPAFSRRSIRALGLGVIFILLFLALPASGSLPAAPAEAGGIGIQIDGVLIDSRDTPLMENGRVLIPLRAVTEYLGGKVNWYPDEQQIIGFRGTKGFDLIIGAATANLGDGTAYPLDVPAKLIRGRAYVPLRFAAEAMGCQAEWDGNTGTVRITTSAIDTREGLRELALPVVVQVITDKGTGSGFFFSKDGQVITNARLVKGAAWIRVKVADRREYTAESLMEDNLLDLAKLRVNREPGEELPVFRYFDDFTGVRAEEPVFAIGSPLLQEEPLTAGVISLKQPSDGQPGSINIYRITAAVTAESSGGPLVKENGAVIGILCFVPEGAASPGPASPAAGAEGVAAGVAGADAVSGEAAVSGAENRTIAGQMTGYVIPIEYVFEMRHR